MNPRLLQQPGILINQIKGMDDTVAILVLYQGFSHVGLQVHIVEHADSHQRGSILGNVIGLANLRGTGIEPHRHVPMFVVAERHHVDQKTEVAPSGLHRHVDMLVDAEARQVVDRKSTRLNSSH